MTQTIRERIEANKKVVKTSKSHDQIVAEALEEANRGKG